MRKSQAVAMLARHLNTRATRLTSLAQRLAEADLLPTASGPPYPCLSPVEIARLLIIGICDEGLGGAPRTVEKYGSLLGSKVVTLESALAHALQRPESVPAAHSGLKIVTGDCPSARLVTVSADGSREQMFGEPSFGSVERIVTVSGSVLHAIASELSGGKSQEDVDALLGAAQVRGAGNGLG